ncbi:hypothetical protein JXI42_02420 [bacterium]|nr:hypothetical protein [bacterium]
MQQTIPKMNKLAILSIILFISLVFAAACAEEMVFISNLELVEGAFDSAISELSKEIDNKFIIHFEGENFFSTLFDQRMELERKLANLRVNANERVDADMTDTLHVEIVNYSLRYPEATRNSIWTSRVIKRKMSVEMQFYIENNEKTLFSNEFEYIFEDEFKGKYADKVNGNEIFLIAEPEHYTWKFYLWEPVLVSLTAAALTYLFYSNR